MDESLLLHEHGTRVFVLTPGAIIGAARQDLKIKWRKAIKECERGRAYAFHRDHVARARCVAELLRLALDNGMRGALSGKRNTRAIYRAAESLTAALRMIGQSEAL
jgi:hypothetical protein